MLLENNSNRYEAIKLYNMKILFSFGKFKYIHKIKYCMNFKKNIIDGTMLLFVVLGAVSYFMFQTPMVAFALFIVAISVGWFRRALYKVMPSF